MLTIWGQANCYAKFIIIMYFVLPVLFIFLAYVVEEGGQEKCLKKR